jgi:CubicO group peptidase (beta-lactamase class C family)
MIAGFGAAIALSITAQTLLASRSNATPANGPLCIHPENLRYFTDGSNKAISAEYKPQRTFDLQGQLLFEQLDVEDCKVIEQFAPFPSARIDSPCTVFPDADWQEASPDSKGVDSSKLKEAVVYLESNFGPDGAMELVIIRNGYLIWKGPHSDAYHNIWSATKTFTSTVLGLLVADGKCALDDLAIKYSLRLDDQYPLYSRIRLRHLASMSSGYKGQVIHVTAEQPWGDPLAYLTPTVPLFEAGTQVQYHDHQVFLLGSILTMLAGESEKALIKRRIADAIGMTQWDWGVSGTLNGLELNNAAGTPTTPGILTTARQMARFGLLYLNHGNWKGKQLLPAFFVDEAAKNQVPGIGESTFLHGRYGFYWWTNDIMPNGNTISQFALFFTCERNSTSTSAQTKWVSIHYRVIPNILIQIQAFLITNRVI